jgi:hypothetical protein
MHEKRVKIAYVLKRPKKLVNRSFKDEKLPMHVVVQRTVDINPYNLKLLRAESFNLIKSIGLNLPSS